MYISIYISALQGHREVVEFLLSHCDYTSDVADSCGTTPFMDAVRTGGISVADLLLQKHQVGEILFRVMKYLSKIHVYDFMQKYTPGM